MRTLLKWLLRLVVLVLVLGGGFFAHVWYFKPYSIDWFYGRVFAQFALQSPELLSNLRVLPSWADFYSSKFDDASPAHEAEMAEMVRKDVETLHRYDRDALDREGQLSYDVLDYFLTMQVEGDKFRDHDFPVNQLFGVQSTLPDFMAQTHQVNNRHDADAYIARLDLFPQKFAQVLEGLRLREANKVVPPKFTVDEVLAQMKAFVATPAKQHTLYTNFKEKLDKIAPAEMGPADRDALLARVEASIEKNVYPAYNTLIDYFATLQPKVTRNDGAWSLPDGDAYYAYLVRMNFVEGTRFTPAKHAAQQSPYRHLLKPIQLSAMPVRSGLHARRTDANGSSAFSRATTNSGSTCSTVLEPIRIAARKMRRPAGRWCMRTRYA